MKSWFLNSGKSFFPHPINVKRWKRKREGERRESFFFLQDKLDNVKCNPVHAVKTCLWYKVMNCLFNDRDSNCRCFFFPLNYHQIAWLLFLPPSFLLTEPFMALLILSIRTMISLRTNESPTTRILGWKYGFVNDVNGNLITWWKRFNKRRMNWEVNDRCGQHMDMKLFIPISIINT